MKIVFLIVWTLNAAAPAAPMQVSAFASWESPISVGRVETFPDRARCQSALDARYASGKAGGYSTCRDYAPGLAAPGAAGRFAASTYYYANLPGQSAVEACEEARSKLSTEHPGWAFTPCAVETPASWHADQPVRR